MIVYISIGNSDDKLSQQRWAQFVGIMGHVFRNDGDVQVHGEWHSSTTSIYQNACWCLEMDDFTAGRVRRSMPHYAREFSQESIAWAEVKTTEFIGAAS